MAKYEDNKNIRCSFCGKTQENVKRIIAGPGVYICNECVGLCSNIIEDELENYDDDFNDENEFLMLTPKEIKEKLDEYVIIITNVSIIRKVEKSLKTELRFKRAIY